MPHQRFFIDSIFEENKNISISGKEFSHIVTVMRNKKNSIIEVVNGNNQLAIGNIIKIEKNFLIFHIQKIIFKQNLDKIIIYQAFVLSNHLEFIIEKGTELGITDFKFFPGEKSINKNITEDKIKRLKLIAISAMKQCGRLDLPTISLLPPIKNWEKNNIPPPLFFGELNPISSKISTSLLNTNKHISYAIGPESGFSNQEISILKKLNVLGINIHPHTLRTETAAIAFATIIKYLL